MHGQVAHKNNTFPIEFKSNRLKRLKKNCHKNNNKHTYIYKKLL